MNKTANPRTIHRVRMGTSFLESACFDFRGWAAGYAHRNMAFGLRTAEPEAPKRFAF